MDSIGHFFGETYRSVAKSVMGVLKESKFYSDGVLTPEEFVAAGDFLVEKCPTWKWCGGNNKTNKIVDYLPENKQFLITTVPCPRRARDYEKSTRTTEKIVEGDWVETTNDVYNRKNVDDSPIDLENEINENNKKENKNLNIVYNDEYISGIDGLDIVKDDDNDKIKNPEIQQNYDFIVVEDDEENVFKTRTYDVTVTYDYYYRVPRMWLIGYGENGTPLNDTQIKEDIMLDYIDKTVTIEMHPHTNVKSISIHPCKHSVLLKRMIENFEKAGKELKVHMSVLLFLKFLHSVVPTIEFDFTMDINF